MFEITKLSYSAISCFEGCETDYYCNYILTLPQIDRKATWIGTGVHKVLECLCALNKQIQEGVARPLVKDEYAGNVYKNTKIEKISDKVYNSIVEKTPKLSWEKADRKKFDNLIKVGLDDKNAPYNYKIIDTEKYFRIPLKEYPWAKVDDDVYLTISGVIDVLYIDKNDQYCVLDYKTGKPEYDWNTNTQLTYKDYYKNTQLCMYYFALRQLYPDIIPVLKIWYLQNNKLVTIYFSDDVIPYVENFIKEKFEKIRQLSKPNQTRSWKCKAFCNWGKQTFSDIGRPDLSVRNQIDNFITKEGEEMTVCEAVHAFFKFRTVEQVTKNCKKDRK